MSSDARALALKVFEAVFPEYEELRDSVLIQLRGGGTKLTCA